ncbi:D-glycero-beta-D-manno-heptose 1-phosphate adenylyltransferase [Actinomycetospora termitidis]|uniref:D-glycero-beta-D-manno-heptose 1-phosphate adenylyltransferase n=1 Tax=Actinomycetospora termitidis TaxID=3053470 RepID=A0ABT7MIU7_9PSEU|nr:D-glycero-beta-D-manno-heptose 1-phosphate adenylyltransferase [Actinomycetospora sp. Odt1-22]MDL5160550.1 D-glycero-beta-D-manno-heptose 1-phosphate adenylyltransferase [Actinomycetospora sp. Odt1-22]
MSAPLLVIGDALLDVDVDGSASRLCPDAPAPVLDATDERPRPGGAALAALLAALSSSRPVRLVTPLGDDASSRRLVELLAGTVEVVGLPTTGEMPRKTRMLAGDRPLLRLDTGGLGGGPWDLDAVAAELGAAGAVLVADYGRGTTADPDLRALLTDAARRVPLVWDPHPKGTDPVPGASLVTPNLAEAGATAGSDWLSTASRAAADLRERWAAEAVVVTAGAHGALLRSAAGNAAVPARAASGGDPCGAGDRFAAAAALALASGRALDDAVSAAVAAASSFVGGGGAGAVRRADDGTWHHPGVHRDSTGGPHRSDRPAMGAHRQPAAPGPDPSEGPLRSDRSATGAHGQLIPGDADAAVALAEEVRGRGGRVVATGGCFDLLHAGHARTLAAARALGDVLIVCLNSDASVARLKGPARPIVGQSDRAELLAALACVDAVAVFDEDDPQALLARLRPDVWVKGGDYAADDLPEAPLVRSWGGEVVAVPYHAGRSSTRLVSQAARSIEGASA